MLTRYRPIAIFAGFLFFVFVGLLFPTQTTHAYIQDGGTASGGNNGSYYTTNGYGWYSYDIATSAGPESWASGGPWSTAKAVCTAEGANKVDAFIVQRPGGNNTGNKSKVYRWETGPGGYSTNWSIYKGDYGGNWLSLTTAEKHFLSIPKASRAGYDFGTNVAWFCYNSYSFDLTPTISTNPSTSVTPEGTVTATGTVTNAAGSTSTSDVTWQITQFTQTPTSRTTGGKDANDPVAFFKGDAKKVTSGVRKFPTTAASQSTQVTMASNLSLGTRICFVMSVKPYNQTTTDWYHSDPKCIVIAKRPVVQIVGGDLRVGATFAAQTAPPSSNVQTSTTVKAGKTYGSWVEYGIFAKGTVTGTGSGSVLNGGLTCTVGCAISSLSFANQNSASIGKFVPTKNIPDIAASFAVNNSTPRFSSLSDASLKRVETADTDITITGGTLAKGEWLVINAKDKKVTITGNINYANVPLQKIADIPQLVIIADRIEIDNNVTNIDAWLVASGTNGVINTCTKSGATDIAITTPLTKDLCQNPLTINGPVMASKLYLRRTAGSESGPQIGVPSETINLRPDAYLWGTYQASRSARLETTYSQELPPRF